MLCCVVVLYFVVLSSFVMLRCALSHCGSFLFCFRLAVLRCVTLQCVVLCCVGCCVVLSCLVLLCQVGLSCVLLHCGVSYCVDLRLFSLKRPNITN